MMAAIDESTGRGPWSAKRLAWVAFAVYLGSMVPFGFVGFWLGFKALMSAISGGAAGAALDIRFMGNNVAPNAVLMGMSWLANPIVLNAMFMLGIGARRGAVMAGMLAILLALCACQVAWIIPGYYIWLASMGMVVYGGVRKDQPVVVAPTPIPIKSKVDRMLDLYEMDA